MEYLDVSGTMLTRINSINSRFMESMRLLPIFNFAITDLIAVDKNKFQETVNVLVITCYFNGR